MQQGNGVLRQGNQLFPGAAGKAHPHDEPGKRVLQEIANLMGDALFADKFVFVEDYDINVGRLLVQGVRQ